MLRIDITSLKAGVREEELSPEPAALDLDPDLFSDIRVDVRLDRHGDRILVDLTARATATLECDRTLVLFDQPVEGHYSLLYAPPDFASEGEEAYEEVRVLHPTDREIDVAEPVRDTLLLALPQRRVAPGAEDVELQTRFGMAEGVDPRWEALRRLKSSGDDEP